MIGLNGGLIGASRVPAISSASGVWNPNEQVLAKRTGSWPVFSFVYRYYRLSDFAATSLNNNTIDFGEIELYNGNTKHTGITCTTNFAFTSGNASALVDGNISTLGSRAYKDDWSTIRSTATITLDLGSPKAVTHIKIFSVYAQPRFPASFILGGSDNNTNFANIANINVGTSFAFLGNDAYSSDKVAVL